MKQLVLVASAVAVSLAAQPAVAGEKKVYQIVNQDVGVPVFPYDIKDRPYEVLGEVKAGVRKAAASSPTASSTPR